MRRRKEPMEERKKGMERERARQESGRACGGGREGRKEGGKTRRGAGRAGPYLHGDDPQLLGGEFPHLAGQDLRLVQDGELRLGGAQRAQQRQAQEAERPPVPPGRGSGGGAGLQPPAAPRHAGGAPAAGSAGRGQRLPRSGAARHAGDGGGRCPAPGSALTALGGARAPRPRRWRETERRKLRRGGGAGAAGPSGGAAGRGRRLGPPRCGRGPGRAPRASPAPEAAVPPDRAGDAERGGFHRPSARPEQSPLCLLGFLKKSFKTLLKLFFSSPFIVFILFYQCSTSPFATPSTKPSVPGHGTAQRGLVWSSEP